MNYIFWNKRDVLEYNIQSHEEIPFDESTLWVRGDMVLGNAATRCRGAGICKISLRHDLKKHDCNCPVIPIFLVRVNPFCLQLVIDKKRITFEQKKKHFLSGFIELSMPLTLSAELSNKLGFNGAITIIPKRYPLYQEKGFYHHFLDCYNEGLKIVP